jgi:hypothetical protein
MKTYELMETHPLTDLARFVRQLSMVMKPHCCRLRSSYLESPTSNLKITPQSKESPLSNIEDNDQIPIFNWGECWHRLQIFHLQIPKPICLRIDSETRMKNWDSVQNWRPDRGRKVPRSGFSRHVKGKMTIVTGNEILTGNRIPRSPRWDIVY